MHNTIYWYFSDKKSVPGNNDWLSAKEKKVLEKLRFVKRRTDWRLGRWTAKNTVQKYLSSVKNLPLAEIEILSRENGAPFVSIANHNKTLTISISHREKKAICILSDRLDSIGCDLEFIEPRSKIFIDDYFTEDEIRFVNDHADQKDMVANLIWSAKESVSKVLQLGLNLSTHDVNVKTIDFAQNPDWNDLGIVLKNSSTFFGKWIQINNYIVTVAATEELSTPVKL